MPITSIFSNQDYEYELIVVDSDGDPIEITAENLPDWLSIESESGGEGKVLIANNDNATFKAELVFAGGIVYDSEDNLFVVNSSRHHILKITPEGDVTVFAGQETGGFGSFAEGNGTSARFDNPRDIVIDENDNLYVTDQSNHRIRKISPGGDVTTLAGNGQVGFENGNGIEAQFNNPLGIDFYNGEYFLVGDLDNDAIRRVDLDGNVTTLEIQAESPNGDISITPNYITHDQFGNILFTNNKNDDSDISVRMISPEGIMSIISGSTKGDILGDFTEARFDNLGDIAVDKSGRIYVAEVNLESVKYLDIDGSAKLLFSSQSIGAANGLSFNKEGDILLSYPTQVNRIKTPRIVLKGNPEGESGEFNIEILATDNQGGQTTQTFELSVTPAPPEITSSNALSLDENTNEAVYTITATDSESITYGLGSGNDESLFTVDQTSGVINFNTPPDFENPQDADANNVYEIEVQASNADATASLLVSITINNVSDVNPVFSTTPIISINDNENYRYEIEVTDADNDTPLISATVLPDWLSIIDNLDGSAVLEGIANVTNDAYDVTLEANDQNGGITQQSFTIQVVDVTGPEFTSADIVDVSENDFGIFYTATVNEINAFTLSLSGGADQALFNFDNNTGELSFNQPPDFENPQDENSDNTYLIEVTAEDASNNVSVLMLSVQVQDIDPEAILRVEGDLEIPSTALGLTSEFSVSAFNDGEADLVISEITYPEGFEGPVGGITITSGATESITFSFKPLESRTYDGDIIIRSNGGQAILGVSADGQIITSIDDPQLKSQLSVYPNPASEIITVDLSKVNIKQVNYVSLLTLEGDRLSKLLDIKTDLIHIDVGNLPTGVVLLEIATDSGSIFKKVIIKR